MGSPEAEAVEHRGRQCRLWTQADGLPVPSRQHRVCLVDLGTSPCKVSLFRRVPMPWDGRLPARFLERIVESTTSRTLDAPPHSCAPRIEDWPLAIPAKKRSAARQTDRRYR